jgi:predicted RNA-binding protein associated with RNAse of E/G family
VQTTSTPPQLIDVINTFTGERTSSSGVTNQLSVCTVEPWGLRTECHTPEDPMIGSETTWILTEAGVRLTHLRARSQHAKPAPTVLTAVRYQRDTRSWRITDLLLGMSITSGSTCRIIRLEEFSTAVSTRVIRSSDANYALRTLHRVLEELARCHHDIEVWLGHQGVVDAWPPR